MSTSTIQTAASREACELGHYMVPDESHVLVGRVIEGELHIFDQPMNRSGRRYFVEAGFESDEELAVLLADYRRQAQRLGACPMSREAIGRAVTMDPAAESSSEGEGR